MTIPKITENYLRSLGGREKCGLPSLQKHGKNFIQNKNPNRSNAKDFGAHDLCKHLNIRNYFASGFFWLRRIAIPWEYCLKERKEKKSLILKGLHLSTFLIHKEVIYLW